MCMCVCVCECVYVCLCVCVCVCVCVRISVFACIYVSNSCVHALSYISFHNRSDGSSKSKQVQEQTRYRKYTHHSGVKVVLQHCYNGVPAGLQWCNPLLSGESAHGLHGVLLLPLLSPLCRLLHRVVVDTPTHLLGWCILCVCVCMCVRVCRRESVCVCVCVCVCV
jgi:hypothetical protein